MNIFIMPVKMSTRAETTPQNEGLLERNRGRPSGCEDS